LINKFYEDANINKWQGHRLLAVDEYVTQLDVSDVMLLHFSKTQTKMPCVRLSQLYDVKNNITLDLQVDSYSTGEPQMALQQNNRGQNKVKYY
jgi:hypothetical protein